MADVGERIETESPFSQRISPAYRRYAIGLLFTIFTLNFVDRQIIGILAEPIKLDLGLKDWQIGAMSGLSFAIFYSTLGIPIARYAEYGHRPRIIAVAVTTWSLFTVLCGFANSFVQLLLARLAVGAGEAGGAPPSTSLIVDYVPRERRSSALATFSMGGPLGALLGLAVGGLAVDALGWRWAFVLVGAPGLIAGLMVSRLREPRTELTDSARAVSAASRLKWREALRLLGACRTYRLFCFGGASQGLIAYGHSAFTAAFFFRVHGLELDAVAASFGLGKAGFLGLTLGFGAGLSGIAGTYLGGKLGDRFGMKSPKAFAYIMAIANLVAIPVYIMALWAPSLGLAIVLVSATSAIYGMTYGPLFTVIQSVTKPDMRATASAVYLLSTNLIGLGLGPLVAGLLSDYLAGYLGSAEGLRWAQIITTFIGFAAAWSYGRSRKWIVADLKY